MAAIRKLRSDRYVVDFHLFGHRIRTFFVAEEPALNFKEKLQAAFPSKQLTSIEGSINLYLTHQTDKRKIEQTQRMERLWFFEFKRFLRVDCKLDLKGSITQVTRLHLEEFQSFMIDNGNVRGDKLSNSSINRRFNTFKNFFARLREWSLIQENPAEHLRRLPERQNRRMKWKQEEIEKYLSTAPYGTLDRDVYVFLLNTGVRLGSLADIKCGDVNMHERTIVIWQRKGNGHENSYVIPISDSILSIILSRLNENFDSHLFRDESGGRISTGAISKRFTRLFARLGLAHLKLHGLRHTFASTLSSRGASTEAVRRLLGHSSGKTTENYLHLDLDQLRRWIT